MATITPNWAEELGAKIGDAGMRFLEAPVAGSRPQAEAGILIFICGGEQATFDAAMPLMEATGGAQHLVGPAGKGAVVKLAVNSLLGIQQAAMAEVLAMAHRNGVDPAVTAGVITTTPAAARWRRWPPSPWRPETPPVPVNLMEKDMGYALSAGDGTDMPLSTATRDVLRRPWRPVSERTICRASCSSISAKIKPADR